MNWTECETFPQGFCSKPNIMWILYGGILFLCRWNNVFKSDNKATPTKQTLRSNHHICITTFKTFYRAEFSIVINTSNTPLLIVCTLSYALNDGYVKSNINQCAHKICDLYYYILSSTLTLNIDISVLMNIFMSVTQACEDVLSNLCTIFSSSYSHYVLSLWYETNNPQHIHQTSSWHMCTCYHLHHFHPLVGQLCGRSKPSFFISPLSRLASLCLKWSFLIVLHHCVDTILSWQSRTV